MSEHPGRHGATQPRALISYAHTPSLVAANGLVTTGSIAMDRADAASAATRPRTGTATPAARQRPRRLWRRLGAAAVLRQHMSVLESALRAADLHPTGWLTDRQLGNHIRAWVRSRSNRRC